MPMGSSGNSSGMMIMLLMVGGVCFLSICCSGGLLALYNFNDSFKDWVSKTFKFGGDGDGDGNNNSDDEISDLAGQFVCPTINGKEYTNVQDPKTGWWWCQGGAHDFLASLLPDDAKVGQTYTAADLQAKQLWGPFHHAGKDGGAPKMVGYDPLTGLDPVIGKRTERIDATNIVFTA